MGKAEEEEGDDFFKDVSNPDIMELEELRKKSTGRKRFSLPSFSLPRLNRASSSLSSAGARVRGRRQAFGAVHFKKEKTFKLVAAAIDKLEVARIDELLKGIEYSELDEEGELLNKAVRLNALDVINVLLKHSAPVNLGPNSDLMPPLHIAARQYSSAAVAVLLAHDADINMRTKFERRTALHCAALAGSEEAVRMLVGVGIDVDAADIYGVTALHLACRACHVGVVSFLLDETNVNVDWYDKEGWTSLHLAAEGGHDVIVSLLLEHKASIDAQSKYGRTSFHWACIRERIPVIRLLMNSGANFDIRDVHEKTPDQYATAFPMVAEQIKLARRQKQRTEYRESPVGIRSLIDITPSAKFDKGADAGTGNKRRSRKSADITSGSILSGVNESASRSLMEEAEEQRETSDTGGICDETTTKEEDTSEKSGMHDSDLGLFKNAEVETESNVERTKDQENLQDEVDDGFVSQHDTSSPQLSSEAENHVDIHVPIAKLNHRESCPNCQVLMRSTSKNTSTCSLHRVQADCTELERLQNRIELNFGIFSSDIDHVTRQVNRAMDTDATSARLLCDASPGLRTLRSKLEAFQSDLIADLDTAVTDLETYLQELNSTQTDTAIKVPQNFKLVQRFCQSVAVALSEEEGRKHWLKLLKALPLGNPAREKMKAKLKLRKYPNECAAVHEVLLLFLEHRNNDMRSFVRTVLDALEMDDDLAGFKDTTLLHLVTSFTGENGSSPSRWTISAVADSLSSADIAQVAREIGVTAERLTRIKTLCAAGEGSNEHTEILNSFLHAADDLPVIDKLQILTDALVYVDREDLLMVLFEHG